MTVMQISLDSICPWVIFIIKPQMYYNKANCNIYNPELMTMSQFIFFLDWKVLKFNVTLKWNESISFYTIYLSIKITYQWIIYIILKYFLWIFVIDPPWRRKILQHWGFSKECATGSDALLEEEFLGLLSMAV